MRAVLANRRREVVTSAPDGDGSAYHKTRVRIKHCYNDFEAAIVLGGLYKRKNRDREPTDEERTKAARLSPQASDDEELENTEILDDDEDDDDDVLELVPDTPPKEQCQ